MNKAELKAKTFEYLPLHMLFFLYSVIGICSKFASREPFLSVRFLLIYGIILLIMGFYAVVWQQILRKIPLTKAYPNKAVTVIWGMLWGILIFSEIIRFTNIIGAILVLVGIVLVVNGNE